MKKVDVILIICSVGFLVAIVFLGLGANDKIETVRSELEVRITAVDKNTAALIATFDARLIEVEACKVDAPTLERISAAAAQYSFEHDVQLHNRLSNSEKRTNILEAIVLTEFKNKDGTPTYSRIPAPAPAPASAPNKDQVEVDGAAPANK